MAWLRMIAPSPVGALQLIASERGIAAILWEGEDGGRVGMHGFADAPDTPVLVETARQLADYFVGRRRSFSVPLDLRGTDFQKAVWNALLDIPFGETRSYAALARAIGRPSAVRAVGAANGRNPVSILVPCHRVVGSNGTLTGFAGGLPAKATLLDLESGDRRLI